MQIIKNFKNIYVFVFLLFFLLTPLHSELRISCKFMGGISTIAAGDLNEIIKENHALFSDYNKIPGCSAGLDVVAVERLVIAQI